MSSAGDDRLAEIAEQFLRLRRDGRRVSIDDVVREFTDVPGGHPSRAEAVRFVARRARDSTANGWSNLDGAAVPADAETALPELENYDIIDRIGRGGMGVVYEAYQHATGRRVAIKFMLEGSVETARRRFEREVELVARLQHPHIAGILDSGVHRGRYWYAMEFVDGESLDAYLAQQRPAPRDVLRLVAAIASAVDHAHQHGVLHRDLKPSNILIDARGEPHVLDFGLAKAVGGTGSSANMTLSEPGQLLGTLAYMSPEQSRGEFEQISVRSDVYALGVIAYEALTGRLPVSMEGPLADVLDRIANRDAVRPSPLTRGLNADVDAILLNSLNKSPAARYATAGEFAADIRRYLNHENVVARHAGVATRAARWMRRNAAVSLVGAVAIVLIGSMAIGAFMRVAAERDKAIAAQKQEARSRGEADDSARVAKLEARKAQRISTFMRNMIRSADPRHGIRHDVTVREVVERAAPTLGTELADEPEVRAAAEFELGSALANIGEFKSAELHLQRSLDERRRLYGEKHVDVARSIEALGGLALARCDYATAGQKLEEAIAIKRALLGPQNDEVAGTLTQIAVVKHQLAEFPASESLFREALAIRRSIGSEPLRVADTLVNCASMYLDWQKLSNAEPLYVEALDIQQKALGPEHPDVAHTLNSLGVFYNVSGNLRAAREKLAQALAMRRKLLGDMHIDVAMSLRDLASLERDDGQYETSLDHFNECLKILRKLVGEEHREVAGVLRNISETHLRAGTSAEAEEPARKAVEICTKLLGPRHPETVESLRTLAVALRETGHAAEAEPLLRECLASAQEQFADQHGSVAAAMCDLAYGLTAAGKLGEAESYFRQAISIYAAIQGRRHLDTAAVMNNLAECLRLQGNSTKRNRFIGKSWTL